MKRRQRRPVLELNNQGGSHETYPQSITAQLNNDSSSQSSPANPLANLLSQYDSDSDAEEPKKDANKLDDQVNNFLKEIQLIAPKEAISENSNISHQSSQQSTCKWRECIDESTGYPYYWHIETNEVTWEMPSELRTLKSATKVANLPATVQEARWVDFSSISYQQSHENIPEGMIPREVVARNRNRYASADQIRKQKEEIKQETANNSDGVENDSDDGRIEMITSFGSESESDTENTENVTNDSPASDSKVISRLKSNDNASSPKTDHQLGLITRNKLKRKRLRLKARVAQEELIKEKEHLEEESFSKKDKRKHESEIDFRVSLVPGYEVESENEEESEHRQERKCLFPIPQEEASESSSFQYKKVTGVLKKVSEDNKTDSNDSIERTIDKVDEGTSNKVDEEETEVKNEKANKFLEALQEPSKAFQRKRRIAFDVPPAKVKVTEHIEISKPKVEVIPETKEEESNTELKNDIQTEENEEDKTEEEENEETKADEEDNNSKDKEIKTEPETKEEEVNPLAQIIQEKLKFLSEGKPTVSPVQTMAIQLQTLVVASEGGYLEKNYLHRWLTETSHELERLEQDAAPPGWLCQWDRSHKRYYYQNASTGATQWTYPDTGIAGGTEEMEICSTPPPADQEDVVSSGDNEDAKKHSAKGKKSKEEDETPNTEEHRSSEPEPPPPPKISNPSPPPPPRIFAEDLKKDKKKKDKGDVSSTESKPEVLTSPLIQPSVSPQTTVIPSIASTEPLPPGVDLSDAPYEIPATALKRILYNTVQGATLYEAAARDPTVPILGHPIVQEHYLQYPAYHQHLHGPTLVLPHKHGVQPAIQLIPDYTTIYTNHKVIEKPPVKSQKESLVSALDSFYSEVAQIEKSEQTTQKQEPLPVEPPAAPPPVEEPPKIEPEPEQVSVETPKEKKKKKARVTISKKHKEVSSMVAKWQRAQQNLDDNT